MPENEINLIKNAFVNALLPQKIYLFGSFAEGTANEDSDFDFYIIVNDNAGNLIDLTALSFLMLFAITNGILSFVMAILFRADSKHFAKFANPAGESRAYEVCFPYSFMTVYFNGVYGFFQG